MSEQYATKEATVAKLKELGFIEVDGETLDSPKNDQYGLPVVQAYVYQCGNGYWCVDVWGDGWQAPIVWHGPKADWDTSDTTEEFIAWSDTNYPGWR